MLILPLNSEQSLFCVTLQGTVEASTGKTFSSLQFKRPFAITLIRPHFALNQCRLVKLYPYISPDDSLPSSLPLTGFNPLTEFSTTPYISGDDEYKELFCFTEVNESSYYAKIFALNEDTFAHTVDCQIIGILK